MARTDFLVSSDYFMAVAVLSAQRSKDPSTQVGACIVNQENKVVGIGNNGMPNGCDGQLPWARTAADPLDNKYFYVCHAELNAIMNKNSADLRDCTIYVTLFPCNECAKLIIQAGIKEVVYLSDKYHDLKETVASRRLLKAAGISRIRQFKPEMTNININFKSPDKPAECSKKQRDTDKIDASFLSVFLPPASSKGNLKDTSTLASFDILINQILEDSFI